MITTTQDAYDVLAFIYDPSTNYKTLIKRDQSAEGKRARNRRVAVVIDSQRAEGMIELAEVVERYHAIVDEYVDEQQAVDAAAIGGAMRDDGRWLMRMYDHARRLLMQR